MLHNRSFVQPQPSKGAPSCSKFDGYVGREDRAVYFAQLEAISEWVSIAGAKLGCCDPDDDKLLETALMGEVNYLITGDQDLLEISSFHDIPILTPRGFLYLRARQCGRDL